MCSSTMWFWWFKRQPTAEVFLSFSYVADPDL